MRVIESHYNGDWRDRVLNAWPLAIHTDAVATLFTAALDVEGLYRPESRSLFYNGFVFLRLTLPFGLWLHVRPHPRWRFQCGIGWKLNGRFGLIFRLQSDESAARGVHGPNVGQAIWWERGTA